MTRIQSHRAPRPLRVTCEGPDRYARRVPYCLTPWRVGIPCNVTRGGGLDGSTAPKYRARGYAVGVAVARFHAPHLVRVQFAEGAAWYHLVDIDFAGASPLVAS